MAVVGLQGSGIFRREEASSVEAEFEVFFCEAFQRVVGIVTVVTADAPLAEDAAQEAFVRAYGRWKKVRGLDRPDAWVARVAVNLALDGRKKLRREAELAPDLEGPVRDQVQEIWMRWNLAQLPPMQRAALVLRYLEGRPVAEVAASLGRSTDTVKSHIRLGRRRLRGLIGGEAGAA